MAINVAAWGYLAWSGLRGVQALQARHLAASRGQIEFYFVFPLLMVAIAIVFPMLLRRTRWRDRSPTILIATLLLLVPFILAYTRGM
jgi:hypothetical protein